MEAISPSNANTVQIVEATKIFDVKDAKNSAIKAYDYYEPGKILIALNFPLFIANFTVLYDENRTIYPSNNHSFKFN